MERVTISSTVPSLGRLPGASEQNLERMRSAGISDVFQLAHSTETELVTAMRLPQEETEAIQDISRLDILRGIGTEHGGALIASGVSSVCALAEEDPDALHSEVRALTGGNRPTAAEVRVWVRAATRRCGQ